MPQTPATRKQVANALLNLLASAKPLGQTIQFSTRLVLGRIWPSLNPGDLPALILYRPNEHNEHVGAGLTRRHHKFVAFFQLIVDSSPTPDNPQDDVMCDFQDAIDAVIAPELSGKQTLGGLVNECYLDGTVEIDGGQLDTHVIIQVPITVEQIVSSI